MTKDLACREKFGPQKWKVVPSQVANSDNLQNLKGKIISHKIFILNRVLVEAFHCHED